MTCTKCGAELKDGSAFCTSCGTPVPPTQTNMDIDQTVLIQQPMDMPAQEPNMAPQQQFNTQPQNMYGQAQPNPFMGQTPHPSQFTGQPQQPNQFTGQPQGMYGQQPNPFMGQPQQPNQFTGQPQGMYGQQPQQFTGQPQGMYGQQPNQFGGQPQGMYGQGQFNQQPQPPKPPRKPLSKKAKNGIIAGSIVAVLAIVFFAVVLPILTKSKLKGEYTMTSSSYYDDTVIVFDDGTYMVYYDDDGDLEIDEAGTYVITKDKIVLTDLEGYKTNGTFDSKKNIVTISSYRFKSTDKKATCEIKLTTDYLDLLEDRAVTAADNAAKDKDVIKELEYRSYYYIYDDDLSDPYYDFEETFAKEIGYSSDKTLQLLMESGYLEIDVHFDSDNEASIDFYVY